MLTPSFLMEKFLSTHNHNEFFYVYVHSPARSCFLYLSSGVERYTGCSIQECMEDPDRLFSGICLSWRDLFRDLVTLETTKTLLENSLAIPWRPPDLQASEEVWTTHCAIRMIEDGEIYTCGVFRDASSQLASLEWAGRCTQIRKHSNALAEAVSDPLFMFNTQGELLSFNSAAEREFPTITAKKEAPIRNLANPATAEGQQWSDLLSVVMHSDAPCDTKIHNNGRIFRARAYPVFDHVGKLSAVCVFAKDVSKIYLLERRLHGFAAALEQSSDGIMLTNPDGTILHVNAAFQRMTGLAESILLRKHYTTVFWGGVPEEIPIPHSTTPWSGRVCMRNTKDESVTVDLALSPVYGPNNILCMTAWTFRDVTERVEAESRMQQAQRCEALGLLSGGIAHDVNNVLGGMIAFAELAIATVDRSANPSLHEYLSLVIQTGVRGRELAKQILSFGTQTQGETRAIALGAIAKETLKLIRASAPCTIKICHRISPEAGLVLADPAQIHQIIVNLSVNAVQAMNETSGTLRLTLGPAVADGRDWVEIGVSDTGVGIPQTNLTRIFEPFFTTKKGTGTGLGLSVVYGIVNACGGMIQVKSEVGHGAYFRVLLPRIKQEQREEAEAFADYPTTRKAVILLVDDEAYLASGMTKKLQMLGHEVVSHTDSAQALDAFKITPDLFDLVITDLTMPHMNGVELIREILTLRTVPIILTTGLEKQRITMAAKASGAREILFKPVFMKELAHALARVLSTETETAIL